MCLNCGCGQPDERHANDANIVTEDLRRAGEANGQDLRTTVRNLASSLTSLASSDMAASGSARGGMANSGAGDRRGGGPDERGNRG